MTFVDVAMTTKMPQRHWMEFTAVWRDEHSVTTWTCSLVRVGCQNSPNQRKQNFAQNWKRAELDVMHRINKVAQKW